MNQMKRVMAAGLCAMLSVSALTGCAGKVEPDDYKTTTAITMGNQKINLDEVNFYLKMSQLSYDYYYQMFYGPYYGFKSYEDFYANTSMTQNGSSMWDSMREDAIAQIVQTYTLIEHAPEYNISLSDEDKEKIEKSVKEFMEDTDKEIQEACGANEELLTKIYTNNALANRVYEYMVADIDTSINEDDYRYTNVGYLLITKKEESTSETTAADSAETKAEGETEAETEAETTAAITDEKLSEITAKAEQAVKDALAKLADDKKDELDLSEIKKQFEDEDGVEITVTSTKKYGKPDDDSKDDLQKLCYNDLKTGDVTTYQSDDKYYVIYCIDEDDADSKKSAIDSELDKRKSTMFAEKYPELVKNSSSYTVKDRVVEQLKFEEIDYPTTEAATTAEETTGDAAEAETTAADSSAEETTAEETTAEETTAEETTAE